MPGIHITTQDDLPGPDGDEPYVLFVNQTEYGNARFLRTNVLSARPDLKKFTALRFRQEVKRHADAIGPATWGELTSSAGVALCLAAPPNPLAPGTGGIFPSVTRCLA